MYFEFEVGIEKTQDTRLATDVKLRYVPGTSCNIIG